MSTFTNISIIVVSAPCNVPPPHVARGLRVFLGAGHGARARYTCFPGYRLEGVNGSYLTCQYGNWTGGHPACVPSMYNTCYVTYMREFFSCVVLWNIKCACTMLFPFTHTFLSKLLGVRCIRVSNSKLSHVCYCRLLSQSPSNSARTGCAAIVYFTSSHGTQACLF